MRVFVTGATGFIGSATVQDLIAAGHSVLGLARSDAGADALAKLGVEAHRGELTDHASLIAGAKACDGVIHTAFIHDFSQFLANIEIDRLAVTAMVGALEGTGKPLMIASGTMMVAHARPATEHDNPLSLEAPRAASEAIVRGAKGVRGGVVRLSPTVHGAGDHGFIPTLIAMARSNGFAAYVGNGQNRWPAVHRLDAARLFRLALEKAPPGAVLHAAAEEGIPMLSIAETIGAGLGLPVKSLSEEEAPAYINFLARFVGTDNPTSCAITRQTLGWDPTGPDLLTDLKEHGYFA
jgi:nucleoside-diphosphate-sugar epimerase